MSRLFSLSAALLVFLSALPASAQTLTGPQSPRLWKPVADLSLQTGSERSLGLVTLMVPLAQDRSTMLFGDLRTLITDQDEWEGNAGIGARKILPPGVIAGGYVFFDNRVTEHGNSFQQVTAGLDAIGEHWDARANIYSPIGDDTKLAFNDGASVAISGTRLFARDGRVFESAMSGWDVEAGHALPFTPHVRAYAGHYSFGADDVDDVEGWRGRLAADLTDWIRLGADYRFSDSVRDNELTGEIRVRVPFDGWQRGNERALQMAPIQKRMMEPVVRDIDIVTQARDRASSVALLTPDGQPANVYFVDNTAAAGGDGSQEIPFNTLAGAQAAAGDYDTIYILQGDGTTAGQNAGITVSAAAQRLLGSGVALTVDTSRLQAPDNIPGFSALNGTTLIAAGTAPVITNAAGIGIDISGDGAEIAGITVDGSTAQNVRVLNADDIVVHDVTLRNSASHGLLAQYDDNGSYDIEVSGITADNNGGSGILINPLNSSISRSTLTGNLSQDNTSRGIHVRSINDTNVTTAISGNTTLNNGSYGIFVEGQNNGTGTSTITGNTSNGNQNNVGIYVVYIDNADGVSDVTGNSTSGNVGFGLLYQARGNATLTGTVTNNTSTANTGRGMMIQARDNAVIAAEVSGNSFTGNGNSGLLIETQNAANITLSLSENSATANTNTGFIVNDDSTGTINADFGGGAQGSARQNRSFGNTVVDLNADMDGGILKAENNWWGDAAGLQPARVTLDPGTTVDFTPFLTVDPDP